MPIFLSRMVRRVRRPGTWALPALVAVFVFATSWPLMALAQPDSRLVHPDVYWWWFLVTASTVGYGDFYPLGVDGHLVGAYVVVGGIATLTTIFTRIAEMLENARGRRMQGLTTLNLTGHVAILGYTTGRTERLVDELVDKGCEQIVVCAWEEQAGDHPMSSREGVDFVRGDLLDDDVLRRACAPDAAVLLVDARDDNEAVSMAVAADHVAPGVHTVVALRDLDRSRTIRRVDDTVRCVQWHSTRMITEEIQDPGIAMVYNELMTQGGGNAYSIAVPDSVGERSFGDVQQALGRRHAATLLAAQVDGELLVSPVWDTGLPPGTLLFYVAGERLGAGDLDQALREQQPA